MSKPELHDACYIWNPDKTLGQLPGTYIWAQVLLSAATLRSAEKARAKLQIPPLYGAIFTGPAGNGRHSTAAALAGTLGGDLLHVRVFGADLDFESSDQAMAAIGTVARAARESGQGLCLILDEPQDCRHSRMIQTRLLRLLERNLEQRGAPVYLIIVTDKADSVLPGLRRLLMVCHCPNPTKEEREAWLVQQLTEPYRILPKDARAMDTAEKTAGFSWHQLTLLVTALRQQLYWTAKLLADRSAEEAVQAVAGEEAKKAARKKATNFKARLELMDSGKAALTSLQFQALLAALRDQADPSRPASAMAPVQVIAGQIPAAGGSAAAEEAPAPIDDTVQAASKPFDSTALEARRSLHANPEGMDFNQLTGNVGLILPDLSEPDPAG